MDDQNFGHHSFMMSHFAIAADLAFLYHYVSSDEGEELYRRACDKRHQCASLGVKRYQRKQGPLIGIYVSVVWGTCLRHARANGYGKDVPE